MRLKLINKILPFIILSNIFIYYSFAQKPEEGKTETLEDIIEDIASNSDEELDYTVLYDDLNFFLNNPLNLNEATEEDLEKLHFLNDFQIQSILKYRERYGDFLTIYELQLLNGYSTEDIERLLPFVMVGKYNPDSKFSLTRALQYGNQQIFLRWQRVLELQEGYRSIDDESLILKPNSRYLGSPDKYYLKYKYQYKDRLYWGLTAEKDPGEAFLKSEVNDNLRNMVIDSAGNKLDSKLSNGFDYYTFHFQVRDFGPVKALAVGDYQLQFGQGLVLWTGMSYGKSPYVMNIKKKAGKVRKYSSTDENLFMRGAGVTLGYKNFDVSGFFSRHKIDGNIVSSRDNDIEELRVTSIQTTGLHTTPAELADKDATGITLFGGNASFSHKLFKIGTSYAYYKFDNRINKEATKYNQFDFEGQENYNVSIDYQFVLKNINFFGEAATSRNGGLAYLNGAMFEMTPQVAFSVLHRNYDRDYYSPYANAFCESKVSNERGLYLGTSVFPIKHVSLTAYYDLYRFPWLKSEVYAPSTGTDYFVQANFAPKRDVSMYFRFKKETKQENQSAETSSPVNLSDVDLMKFRYHISYNINKALQLKNRLEIARYQKSENYAEWGYMIYQDIIYKPFIIPLSLALRYAVFDATYNARIYAYENDLLYTFSVPAYNYKGTRAYIMVKYTIYNGVDIWLRFGQFYYSDRQTIGSDLTEINGRTKSEVKVQIRYKF